jgi:2-polyprenyl-3-methyl-5-hydroxy-6-metoxy-1,4-benzoquinol methylase
MEFRKHNVEWTGEKVGRFWNFISRSPVFDETYFTNQVGDGLLALVREKASLGSKILDYGTGKGYLVKYLLSQKIGEITGCDFSKDSVRSVNEAYAGNSLFKECHWLENLPSPLPADYFDSVFCVETIEHLCDEYIHSTFEEIKRVMKPGAVLVVTTPNNEDLDKAKVLCPDCGAIFHRVQHVRSFTKSSLVDLFAGKGITPIFCEAVDLRQYKPTSSVKLKLKRLLHKLHRHNTAYRPHLVYIGKYNG